MVSDVMAKLPHALQKLEQITRSKARRAVFRHHRHTRDIPLLVGQQQRGMLRRNSAPGLTGERQQRTDMVVCMGDAALRW